MKNMALATLMLAGITLACSGPDLSSDEIPQDPVSGRYSSEVFTEVQVDSVQFDSINNLWMDIYTPEGDDWSERRLVMLAHGGAFVSGTRKNELMVELATLLAKHGYVAVSYSYRLASSIATMQDSIASLGVVTKSMIDGTEALGYMINRSGEYGIDADKVALGGNSAGAVLSLHIAHLDQDDDLSPTLDSVINHYGGWGRVWNEPDNRTIKAVVSLAGGILKTHFLSASGPELLMAHDEYDAIVPFNCNHVLFNNQSAVVLCGTGAIGPYADAIGLANHQITFPDLAHCSWSSDQSHKTDVFEFVLQELKTAMD